MAHRDGRGTPIRRWPRGARALRAALGLLALGAAGPAAAVDVRVRWAPSTDPAVTAYVVYVRAAGTSYGQGQSVAAAPPAADGSLASIVTGVSQTPTHFFAVTALKGDGTESGLSNELPLGPLDPCNLDRCFTRSSCQVTPAPNGTACSDGNPCNGAETCQAGICAPGVALNCSDGNRCTTDSCSPTSGCIHTPIAGCTTNTCTTAADCNDGNPCTTDTCSNGGCQHTPVANGTSCSDGNACNGAETCQAGACTPGTPLSCSDGNPCTSDTCNPATGCVFTAIPGCTGCTTNAACDDHNPCTTDVCTAGVCQHTPLANGTSCSDGNRCNGTETCQAGNCTAGVALKCSDGNPCTSDTCNPATGCVFTAIPGCTGCTTNAACDDHNPCTTDVCAAGACQHTPLANGTSCSDGNRCNGTETCQAGTCTPSAPLNCSDGNACTNDGCDPAIGCIHTAIPGCTGCTTNTACDDHNPCTTDSCTSGVCQHTALPNGTSCSDGNRCNGDETCAGGVCASSGALNCTDTDPCTTDSCSPAVGCTHSRLPNCPGCLTNGDCDDGNPCTADSCNAGACQHSTFGDGTLCSDGNACDGQGVCRAGLCVPGAPLSCVDSDPCTLDGCSPATGCIHRPVANCSPCLDPTRCDDHDPCTDDACDPSSGCSHTPIPDCVRCVTDGQCDDGNTCTVDSCEGVCRHIADPGNLCDDAARVLCDALCTAPTCGTPARGFLNLNRLRASSIGSSVSVRMTGSATPPANVDPATTGMVIGFADTSRTVLYQASVPGSALVGNSAAGDFAFYEASPQPGGIQRLMLRGRGGLVRMSVRADAPGLNTGAVTELTTAALMGDQCVAATATCSARGRRLTCKPLFKPPRSLR